ncbi:hypothetical protein O3M35_006671 [Rhynocoris fuscipes]|uniref:Uncharacterized protein n=1 Tax=Rhynocoris fuscipes TaxID=488301 RepID=A0AAW1DH08_9HEMI
MICPKYTNERNKAFKIFYKCLEAPFCYEQILFSNNLEVIQGLVELARVYECV